MGGLDKKLSMAILSISLFPLRGCSMHGEPWPAQGAGVGESKIRNGYWKDQNAWHLLGTSCLMTSPPWISVYLSRNWAGSPLLRGLEEVVGDKALWKL